MQQKAGVIKRVSFTNRQQKVGKGAEKVSYLVGDLNHPRASRLVLVEQLEVGNVCIQLADQNGDLARKLHSLDICHWNLGHGGFTRQRVQERLGDSWCRRATAVGAVSTTKASKSLSNCALVLHGRELLATVAAGVFCLLLLILGELVQTVVGSSLVDGLGSATKAQRAPFVALIDLRTQQRLECEYSFLCRLRNEESAHEKRSSYPLGQHIQETASRSRQCLFHLVGHKLGDRSESLAVLLSHPISLQPRLERDVHPKEQERRMELRALVSCNMSSCRPNALFFSGFTADDVPLLNTVLLLLCPNRELVLVQTRRWGLHEPLDQEFSQLERGRKQTERRKECHDQCRI